MAFPTDISSEVTKGILRVDSHVRRFLDPDGQYPKCIPKIGRSGKGVCERCEKNIDISDKSVCDAVPSDRRWSVLVVEQKT